MDLMPDLSQAKFPSSGNFCHPPLSASRLLVRGCTQEKRRAPGSVLPAVGIANTGTQPSELRCVKTPTSSVLKADPLSLDTTTCSLDHPLPGSTREALIYS